MALLKTFNLINGLNLKLYHRISSVVFQHSLLGDGFIKVTVQSFASEAARRSNYSPVETESFNIQLTDENFASILNMCYSALKNLPIFIGSEDV